MGTAFIANTNILDLRNLKNEITQAFINGATVEVTIRDATGAAVAGQTWPVTMSYVAASDGDYRAIISEDVEFTKQNYTAYIDSDGGPGLVGHWEFKFKPQIRTGENEEG